MHFIAYLLMRLIKGDYSRTILVEYVDGVERDEPAAWIQLSRRGETYIALGSVWLAPDLAESVAELPGYHLDHGRLVAADDVPGRLVHSTVRAFRDVMGAPHPAFLEVVGVDPNKERSFRSPYVEQDRPPF
ncbi:MAG: hypothetical protein L0H93_22530 [Nocardioides sp.]|nr:hypothetical protein [Nocardioides sp.]